MTKDKLDKPQPNIKYFPCNCGDPSHVMYVEFIDEPAWDLKEIYLGSALYYIPGFFDRLKNAVKVLTGKVYYTHDVALDLDKAKEFIDTVNAGLLALNKGK